MAIPRNVVSDITYTKDEKDLQMNLYRKMQEVIAALNKKDTALYDLSESFSCGQWYVNAAINQEKGIYRKVIDFGALPNTVLKTVAHELNIDETGAIQPITADWKIIIKNGMAFDPINIIWYPISNPTISMEITTTDIEITTTADLSAYTECEIILLYTKP